eukprot:576481-Rhodomonas_salina.3
MILSPTALNDIGYAGVGYAACVGVVIDGGNATAQIRQTSLDCLAKSTLDIVVAGATRYRKDDKTLDPDPRAGVSMCEKTLRAALARGYDAVRKAHVTEH